MDINTRKLRKDVMDNFGTAMHSGFPMAIMDLSEVGRMTDEELIEYALRHGIDLGDYTEDRYGM